MDSLRKRSCNEPYSLKLLETIVSTQLTVLRPGVLKHNKVGKSDRSYHVFHNKHRLGAAGHDSPPFVSKLSEHKSVSVVKAFSPISKRWMIPNLHHSCNPRVAKTRQHLLFAKKRLLDSKA
mmetsp:Transcript_2623/g.5502  ORF Transcript_2623/g.5502 Transcript_2623/m.5502 type:complete len:121 (-) Transcript_2623:1953-2315(-)